MWSQPSAPKKTEVEGGKEDIFPPPVTAADIDRPVGDLRGSDAREVDTQTASAPLVTSTAVRDEEFRDYLTGSAAGQTASGMRAVSESGGGGSALRNMLADAADPSHAMLVSGDLAEQNIGLQ